MVSTAFPVFTRHTGIVVPLDRANVDTDQIIPKQFLKSIKKTGFGENLFDSWRYQDEGNIGKTDRIINPEFVLNDPRYQEASILLARRNFGCGSSREHAVWAILQYGIRCVLAPSYADIFYNNSFNNGLLPIELEEALIDRLFREAIQPSPMTVEVDLAQQTISSSGGIAATFDIDATRKHRLMTGMDNIALTLEHQTLIEEFELTHRQRMPWLFSD
ncbi:MAG: 3-isopropylmalate dehydratase small subunit [Gammaproteobacteria bacterium]|nr:3-isopropylmalate dehydratase small subunit [Gammaproteobacteria bacterium]MYC26328.1 3-isopropylmalate dehydratase small subunit [Gammaproteobacteria bacterium]